MEQHIVFSIGDYGRIIDVIQRVMTGNFRAQPAYSFTCIHAAISLSILQAIHLTEMSAPRLLIDASMFTANY
jgi:hypothetical protein